MAQDRISRIETLWSIVRTAQASESTAARTAQEQILERYSPAIKRYLRGALRNEDAADELYQEFALRFLNGKYASADAERGRFRSFLKTILYRLVAEHYRRRNRDRMVSADSQVPEPADPTPPEADDEEFAKVWSEELLKKAMSGLANLERRTGRPLFTVMQAKVDHPELRSPDIAELVSQKLGREISTGNVRVILHRARDTFADLLVQEVEQSLDSSSAERIAEELGELDLLSYCRPALERRRQ